jgi:hypothetical protein
VTPRQLAVVLTLATGAGWYLWFQMDPVRATLPLRGLLPLQLQASGNISFLLGFVLCLYCCVPVIAWIRRSVRWAWAIPIAPLLGLGLFIAQVAIGFRGGFTQ